MCIRDSPKTTGVMAALIVLALSWLAVCTYTGKKQDDIGARAGQWAQAFCDRDGTALYGMYDPGHPEGFYKMEPVMSLQDDPYISFGWSSPWPMDHLYQDVYKRQDKRSAGMRGGRRMYHVGNDEGLGCV